MDDKTFRQLQCRLETECEFKLKSLAPLHTGNSDSLTQIAYTSDDKKYIVKLIKADKKYTTYINTLYALNSLSKVIPKCVKGFLFCEDAVCIVTEWIEGTEVDFRCADIEKLDIATSYIADIVRKLHKFPVKNNGREFSVINDVSSSFSILTRYNIVLPHDKAYRKYLDDPANIPCMNERRGYIHFDLHMQNIIKCEHSDYRLIDLELIGISDVWRDFVYAVCINHPDEQKFWLLFILNYFEDDIPEDFFRSVKFYVVLFMIMLVKSNYLNKTLEHHFMLAEKIFNEYGALKYDIPLWIKYTAEKILRLNTKHQKQLIRLIKSIEEERSVNGNNNT